MKIGTEEIRRLVNKCNKIYPKGFIANVKECSILGENNITQRHGGTKQV